MNRTFPAALAHHASIASYGSEIGTRGPMLTERDAPRWVVTLACVAAAFFVITLVRHGEPFVSYLRSFV